MKTFLSVIAILPLSCLSLIAIPLPVRGQGQNSDVLWDDGGEEELASNLDSPKNAAPPKTGEAEKEKYPIQVEFTPNIRAKLAGLVQGAKSSICIAAYNLFLPEVSLSLLGARDRGVYIRIILDDNAATLTRSDYAMFRNNKIPIKLGRGITDAGDMRLSFAIFDGELLVVGPYDWTEPGDSDDMGCLNFTKNPKAVKKYMEKFDQLWGS